MQDGIPLNRDRRQVTIKVTVRTRQGGSMTLDPEYHVIGDDSMVPFTYYPPEEAVFIVVEVNSTFCVLFST